uniref:Uncharacterized protein n=1 Tax=Amphimedon queenslandica TaxID=400682 RepID=A0A1X7SI23_AMPQE
MESGQSSLIRHYHLAFYQKNLKSPCIINKQTKYYTDRADDDISMQVCEPYEMHRTKLSVEDEGVYDECQASPED